MRKFASTASVRGMTLIELMVSITIFAIALTLSIPSFGEWLQNSQLRSTAESMQNGIQFARAEAVRRNNPTQFQFVSTTDNTCALATAGPYWVVNMPTTAAATPVGACGATPSDATSPYILQFSPVVSTRALTSMTVAASQKVISFDGLGRQTASVNPATPAAQFSVDITPVNTSSCVANGGTLRCLRVTVSTMGQVRMCDPSLTAGSTPTAC
ncbi:MULTISPECIES: GspH/FimT family pseudopilin [unclassified Variovorax]|uniref:GspH/FimT family pseudopilin n=1 Tax=unclassified Variovorax TaxID=663243 RepID=UPI001BD4D52D|nr:MULTISPECIES: GspH/FimT family pseudopilin [unclassified Variovorax]